MWKKIGRGFLWVMLTIVLFGTAVIVSHKLMQYSAPICKDGKFYYFWKQKIVECQYGCDESGFMCRQEPLCTVENSLLPTGSDGRFWFPRVQSKIRLTEDLNSLTATLASLHLPAPPEMLSRPRGTVSYVDDEVYRYDPEWDAEAKVCRLKKVDGGPKVSGQAAINGWQDALVLAFQNFRNDCNEPGVSCPLYSISDQDGSFSHYLRHMAAGPGSWDENDDSISWLRDEIIKVAESPKDFLPTVHWIGRAAPLLIPLLTDKTRARALRWVDEAWGALQTDVWNPPKDDNYFAYTMAGIFHRRWASMGTAYSGMVADQMLVAYRFAVVYAANILGHAHAKLWAFQTMVHMAHATALVDHALAAQELAQIAGVDYQPSPETPPEDDSVGNITAPSPPPPAKNNNPCTAKPWLSQCRTKK